MTMSITGLVVTILIIVLGIFDMVMVVIGYLKGKSTGETVSTFLIKLGISTPFTAFAFGYVAGHLFGYMYPLECPPPSANILAPNFWMIAFFAQSVFLALTRFLFPEKK